MFLERFNAFVDGRENKVIAALGIFGGVCVVVIAICLIMQAIEGGAGRTYLSLNIAPSEARTVIDGKEYKNGVWDMPRGTYQAEIKADGFESKTVTISVTNGTTTIYDYVVNKAEGMKWFEKDGYGIDALRHIKNDSKVSEFFESYDKELSIKEKLPLSNNYMSGEHEYKLIEIDDGSYTGECERVFCLRAKGSGFSSLEEMKKYVSQTMAMNEYRFSDYEVIYEYD